MIANVELLVCIIVIIDINDFISSINILVMCM